MNALKSKSEAATSNPGVKPRLRGVPDIFATILAVPAGVLLIVCSQSGVATVGATIYAISLVFLYAISALYHTPMWSKRMRHIWRRVDHSAVYILIAGSATPVALMLVPSPWDVRLLATIWTCAILGLFKSVFWPGAPRWLNTAIYIGMGWVSIPAASDIAAGAGHVVVALIVIGGVIYTAGAFIYARRWPNPRPDLFGYHEVFHMLVIAGSVCHYVAFWQVLT